MPNNDTRIVVLDVESTGPSPSQDHIVEFSAQVGLGDEPEVWTQRMRPGIPITPGAEAVHGISNADVADLDSFSAHADPIRSLIENADVIVGYNVGFDIEMIFAEFSRHGLDGPSLATTRIVDPFLVWRTCEPRNLQSAHRRFVGEEFEGAHSAEADIAATARVLQGMIRAFDLGEKSWTELAALGVGGPESWIGPSSHIKWRDGHPTLAFGQHRGRTLDKRISDLALTWNGDALVDRLIELYGEPPEGRATTEKPAEPDAAASPTTKNQPPKSDPPEQMKIL
jgi:DNA polymerase-3 subunit epsilon